VEVEILEKGLQFTEQAGYDGKCVLVNRFVLYELEYRARVKAIRNGRRCMNRKTSSNCFTV